MLCYFVGIIFLFVWRGGGGGGSVVPMSGDSRFSFFFFAVFSIMYFDLVE